MTLLPRTSFLKRKPELIMLVLLGAAFFVLYSFSSFGSPTKFVSPDETANYFFTKSFAQSSSLSVSEPLDSFAPGLIRPRSVDLVEGKPYTDMVQGKLVPNSFIGLPLIYGLIAKVFSLAMVRFITPMIAIIAVIFFYLLVKQLFDNRIAFFSSLLLFLQPAFWYFSGRSMMHNVPFASCVIITVYFFIKAVRFSKLMNYIFLGIALGLAIIFRVSEAIWLLPMLLILFLVFKKRISWLKAAVSLLTLCLFLLPIGYLNNKLYGNPLAFGYSQETLDFGTIGSATTGLGLKISQALFPFGLNLGLALHNFYDYFIVIFPWYAIPFGLGLVLFFRNWLRDWLKPSESGRITRGQKTYALAFLFILIWLVLYYGSWDLKEFSDPDRIILGHSYLRYWLPVFIFSLPFCATGLSWMIDWFKTKKLKIFFGIFLACLIVALSITTVLFDPLYGLAKIRRDIAGYEKVSQEVVKLTPKNSVVITGKGDKVIFPERKVIAAFDLGNIKLRVEIKGLAKQAPIYYYCQPVEINCQELEKQAAAFLPTIKLIELSTLSDQASFYKLEFP
ncbi:MAG: glycosyltransferase family 39 protein [Patescibacteria group bacterium]|nr:glycosyltransferase family 39 protein [Patescibacteria group bacterium]